MKSAMLSGSWFSKPEEEMLAKMKAALKENKTIGDIYWCLDDENQWEGIDVSKHPEKADDIKWQKMTYSADLLAIQNQDVIVAMVVAGHEDSGMAQEIGYAKALGKPVVLVRTAEDVANKDSRINLMIAMSGDAVISIDELPNYDFDHIRLKPYRGKVY